MWSSAPSKLTSDLDSSQVLVTRRRPALPTIVAPLIKVAPAWRLDAEAVQGDEKCLRSCPHRSHPKGMPFDHEDLAPVVGDLIGGT
jgi:hypothetical protein